MTSWRVTSWKAGRPRSIIATRNPYYWKVDPQGNQLPYIDELRLDLVENGEALNLKAINGEIDLQFREIEIAKYSLLQENRQKNDYRVLRWPDANGSPTAFFVNQTIADPDLRPLFQNVQVPPGAVVRHQPQADQRGQLLRAGQGAQRDPDPGLAVLRCRRPRRSTPSSTRRRRTAARRGRAEEGPRWLSYAGERQAARADHRDVPDQRRHLRRRRAGAQGLGERRPEGRDEVLAARVFLAARRRQRGPDRASGAPTAARAVRRPGLRPAVRQPLLVRAEVRRLVQLRAAKGREATGGVPRKALRSCSTSSRRRSTRPSRSRSASRSSSYAAQNLWVIGTVGAIPSIAVVKNNFRNVPENAVTDWIFMSPGNLDPAAVVLQEVVTSVMGDGCQVWEHFLTLDPITRMTQDPRTC